MRSRFKFLSLVLALGAFPAISGCGQGSPPADFRFLNSEPETIDPGRVGDQAGGRIVSNLFEGLTVRGTDLLPGPGIAESWEVSDDGLTWTFHLRSSQWSDGRELTSQDFVWSWRRLLDPATASRSSHLLHAVRGAIKIQNGEKTDLGLTAPDLRTFVVSLSRPVSNFDEICSLPALCPSPRHAIESHGEKWTRPEHFVGNGPFVLEEWRLHDRLRMRRNPRYWNVGAVALERVDAVSGNFANTNFNLYESGLLDWVDSGGVPPHLVDALRVRADWHEAPFLATYFLRCNVRRPPLDDSRVRRALALSIDARAITDHVTRAGQTPATSLVPALLRDYTPAGHAGRQPDSARELLAGAGYPGGAGFPPITLLISTSEWHRQIAEVLQQQWRETLGIDVQIQNQEWKVFAATVRAGDYELARGSWIADFADAGNFLEIWHSESPNNRTGFSDARVDSLLSAAALQRSGTRARTLQEVERIVVVDEAVILPLYFYSVTNLYDADHWEGLEPDPMNTLDLRRVRVREQGR